MTETVIINCQLICESSQRRGLRPAARRPRQQGGAPPPPAVLAAAVSPALLLVPAGAGAAPGAARSRRTPLHINLIHVTTRQPSLTYLILYLAVIIISVKMCPF